MGVSEGPGAIVEGAEASVKRVVGRGHLDTVWAPDAEEERSGVTGSGQRAPGEVGGRVEGSEEAEDPGENRGGWEALGSSGKVSPGLSGGESEAWTFEGPVGKVCMLDAFVLRRSWRRWSAGLGGAAGGGPGQELQLTGTWVSPRGLRAALPNAASP